MKETPDTLKSVLMGEESTVFMEETLKKKNQSLLLDAPVDWPQMGRDDNIDIQLIIKANRNTKVSEMALQWRDALIS